MTNLQKVYFAELSKIAVNFELTLCSVKRLSTNNILLPVLRSGLLSGHREGAVIVTMLSTFNNGSD